MLGRLRTNAHSLLELINATLEVNRLEAGRTGVQLREVDLRQLLTELQHETDHTAAPARASRCAGTCRAPPTWCAPTR